VDLQGIAPVVLDDDLRVQVALVLHDEPVHDARARVALGAEGLALDDLLEADAPAALGQDRHTERVPLAQQRAGLNLLAVLDLEDGAVGDGELFELLALGAEDQHLTVARQGHALAQVVGQHVQTLQLDRTGALGLELGLLDLAVACRRRRCGTCAW
jgi:hypothetical protein